MRDFQLSFQEIKQIKQHLKSTKELREFKRLQAILLVTEGICIKKVASIIGVTVQSIYNWLDRYEINRDPKIMEEGNHTGRPPTKSKSVSKMLTELFNSKPKDHGYKFSTWNARLITEHLRSKHNLQVSISTVRRCLKSIRNRTKYNYSEYIFYCE